MPRRQRIISIAITTDKIVSMLEMVRQAGQILTFGKCTLSVPVRWILGRRNAAVFFGVFFSYFFVILLHITSQKKNE